MVLLNLTHGQYTLATFFWAAAAGALIGIPAALLNWAYLRSNRAAQVGILGQTPRLLLILPFAQILSGGLGGEAPPTTEEEAKADDETKASRVSAQSEDRPHPRAIPKG